jgi:hypothetical protein
MKKFGLILIGIFVALASLEIYLRIFHPQPTLSKAIIASMKCFMEGSHSWLQLQPNHTCELTYMDNPSHKTVVKTNSLGFRNPEITLQKPPDTTRILFIGDSFTMGWGVNETDAYPRVVEKLLNQNDPHTKIETINAGFAGGEPSGYYQYLKYSAFDLNPDIVVIGFFLGNDITGEKDIRWTKVSPDGLPDKTQSDGSYVDKEGMLRFRTMPLRYQFPIVSDSNLFILLMKKLFVPTNQKAQEDSQQLEVCLHIKDCRYLDPQRDRVKKLFIAMKKLTDEKGKKLLVVLIPTEYEAYPEKESKYGMVITLTPQQRKSVSDEFGAFFTQNNIDHLDLRPEFLKYLSVETFIPYDIHWNPLGHQIAAQAISEKLQEMLKKK